MMEKRFIAMVLVAILLIVSIIACGSTPEEQPSAPDIEDSEIVADETEPSEEQLPTEPPSPEASEEVEISFYGISVVDPDEPGMFYSAEEGKHLVSIEVAIENNSGEAISVNPLNTTLIDNQGLAYMLDLGSSENHDQIDTLDLFPGERIRGWISFKIEDGSSPSKIKYELDMWTGEVVEADLTQTIAMPEWSLFTPVLQFPGLGETSSVAGYSLSALSVVDPSQPGILYTPEEGLRLISIEIMVRNESGAESLSVNPLYAYLVDNIGFIYAVELGSSDLGQIDTLDLAAGEAAKGYVTFEVPQGNSALYVRYVTDFWGDADPLVVGLR